MSEPSPLKVFITYSHKNRAEKDELKTSTFHHGTKREIQGLARQRDARRRQVARNHLLIRLAESDMLLYLTSADSLASESCNERTGMEALERGKEVIPIILEDCDWKAARGLNATLKHYRTTAKR